LKRIVVLAMLVALACGRAERDRAPDEATLRAQLTSMRSAIAAFTKAYGHGPATLREAMPSVPIDPLTHSATTWRLTTEETVQFDDFTTGSASARRSAIVDVHSGAVGRDAAGKEYSSY
jgi:general secretion pathway protein G